MLLSTRSRNSAECRWCNPFLSLVQQISIPDEDQMHCCISVVFFSVVNKSLDIQTTFNPRIGFHYRNLTAGKTCVVHLEWIATFCYSSFHWMTKTHFLKITNNTLCTYTAVPFSCRSHALISFTDCQPFHNPPGLPCVGRSITVTISVTTRLYSPQITKKT